FLAGRSRRAGGLRGTTWRRRFVGVPERPVARLTRLVERAAEVGDRVKVVPVGGVDELLSDVAKTIGKRHERVVARIEPPLNREDIERRALFKHLVGGGALAAWAG